MISVKAIAAQCLFLTGLLLNSASVAAPVCTTTRTQEEYPDLPGTVWACSQEFCTRQICDSDYPYRCSTRTTAGKKNCVQIMARPKGKRPMKPPRGSIAQ